MTLPSALSESNQRELRRLLVSIRADACRLGLHLAVCDDWEIREILIRIYESILQEEGWQIYQERLDPDQPSLKDTLARLRQENSALDTDQKAVVTVLGVTELLGVCLTEERSEQEKFFFSLQWTREALREFEFPVIIWLSSSIATNLSQQAKDFWSWRSGVFEFEDQPRVKPSFQDPELTPDNDPSSIQPEIRELLQQISQLYSQDPDSPLLMTFYSSLGDVYQQHSDYELAVQAYEQALARARSHHNLSRQGEIGLKIGKTLQDLHRDQQAYSYYQQALSSFIEIEDLQGQAQAYRLLGAVAQELQNYKQAQNDYQQALRLSIELGDRHEQGIIYFSLGWLTQELQKYEQARDYYEQALNRFIETGDHHNQKITSHQLEQFAEMERSRALALAQQMGEWFEVLDYHRDPDYEVWTDEYFEWIINFPLTRKRTARILVRGVDGEVGMDDLQDFQKKVVEQTRCDEGWLVGNRRVAKAVRSVMQEDPTYEDITCYTFDELLDEDADFEKYLDWLEEDIRSRKIDTDYIPLACRKDELDPTTLRKIGVSVYEEEDGWIEGYVDQWLADPAKEHLSVLGEFGTGKTWFALHYAWVALQKYREAKRRRVERPRIPIVVPLRDYAKAVSVESLFSEFFFRKHEILKNYSVFDRLNRMGKLLLIFDGFDEMAARINRQAMIDNFWELAKVVVPGAKAILTCRTEHFPDAIEGRRVLRSELKASTAKLSGEPPQFEVLELEPLSDPQIEQLLSRKAEQETVQKVMADPLLLDLARRPVMVDLILEALPDIEAGKPIDMARVYLYAVTRKMERDIKSERTFTSLADKLYFLCELSWEMLTSDRMSLNYQVFPDRLKLMFGERVQEEKELDYWRYDMMGQTMLIRNSEGDYSPAHRSLLEFFVAYKIVASLGAMAEDFTEVARQQSYLVQEVAPQDYRWNGYFRRACDGEGTPMPIPPLAQFEAMAFADLVPLLGQAKLPKAVLDLAHPMVDRSRMQTVLLPLLRETRERTRAEVGYVGGNVAQLMLAQDPHALAGSDLRGTRLRGVDFSGVYLQRVKFQGADLYESVFSKVIGTVYSVSFSPTGELLAIGDSKGVVQIWNAATGQVVSFCTGHQREVRSVAFSPDGQTLASGSDDETVKLWGVASGDCLRTLQGHGNTVWSVAFSPDGQILASGSSDATVKLWGVASGDCLRTLQGHGNTVRSVAFSPDGQTLASGSSDETVKLWGVASGDCLRTLQGHGNTVWSVAFSPDGQILASGSSDATVKLWGVASGDCLRTLQGHGNTVRSVAFSPDGQTLASGSSDETVKLWGVASGDCLRTLPGHGNTVWSVAFSPDGQTLASGSSDATVKLWGVASGDCLRTLPGHGNPVLSVAFSPDGQTLASGSSDETVKLWGVASGDCLRTLPGHGNPVWSVAFSPDGQTLASGSSDATVKLWGVASGDCLRTLPGHGNPVLSVAFSPDGQTLASGSSDETVKLWGVASGDCLRTLPGHGNTVWSVAFSPDGQTLASGSSDATVKLWGVASGDCLRTLPSHGDWVLSVAFSPDGQTLASGSDDETVKLWGVASGDCLRTLPGHGNPVGSVAFSPDGQTLASGSDDETVKLWGVASGDCLRTLPGHRNPVWSVAFSPDGQILASGSSDATIRLWDVATGSCIRVIDDRVCGGMDVTGAIGLTAGQRAALQIMGAQDGDPGVEDRG